MDVQGSWWRRPESNGRVTTERNCVELPQKLPPRCAADLNVSKNLTNEPFSGKAQRETRERTLLKFRSQGQKAEPGIGSGKHDVECAPTVELI